mmetsp:Transcript_103570/g.263043  ORF Transcript_103570/g.263043 Transcript_103570/m.263043 type:complete len:366 (+) Transcript_103570:77-1174(+)
MVEIWDCANSTMEEHFFKFVMPPLGQDGWIQWDFDLTLCLNAPDGSKLQLWYCVTAPPKHTKWRMSQDGSIHLASRPDECLQVSNGVARNGNKVQLGDCESNASNFRASKELPLPPSGGGMVVGPGTTTITTTTTVLPDKHLAHLRLRAAPEMCADVWGDHAGAVIQMWNCSDYEGADVNSSAYFEFYIPDKKGNGTLQWKSNPELCLDAPEMGDEVQLWYCDTAASASITWQVLEDGQIQLAERPGRCLDVPGEGAPENGQRLRMSDCPSAGMSDQQKAHMLWWLTELPAGKQAKKQEAREEQAQDDLTACLWSDWSKWSDCDETCHRYADRTINRRALPGGKSCIGGSTRFEPCGPGSCHGAV